MGCADTDYGSIDNTYHLSNVYVHAMDVKGNI